MTTRNEILGWMRRGIERGKTIPDFEELLDAFVTEVREEERERIIGIVKECCDTTEPEWIYKDIMEALTQPNNTK